MLGDVYRDGPNLGINLKTGSSPFHLYSLCGRDACRKPMRYARYVETHAKMC